MKKTNSTADTQIKKLQQDIVRLSDKLAATEKLTDYYADSYESVEKQRIACRKLIKYHTLVLIIMNLVYQYTDGDDMGRAIRTNINRYYKGLTADLIDLQGDDTTSLYDYEFYDEEEDKDGEDEL